MLQNKCSDEIGLQQPPTTYLVVSKFNLNIIYLMCVRLCKCISQDWTRLEMENEMKINI